MSLDLQSDICVFVLASTESFEIGCLCLRRINWRRQLLEITWERPCLGSPLINLLSCHESFKAVAMPRSATALLPLTAVLQFIMRLVTDKDTCSMPPSPDICFQW